MLTDQEVLSLTHVLVRNNHSITKILYVIGSQGYGNTNTSGYSANNGWSDNIADLAGKSIQTFCPFDSINCASTISLAVVAIVEDVVYIVSQGKVYPLPQGQRYTHSNAIAYDTYGFFSLYGG